MTSSSIADSSTLVVAEVVKIASVDARPKIILPDYEYLKPLYNTSQRSGYGHGIVINIQIFSYIHLSVVLHCLVPCILSHSQLCGLDVHVAPNFEDDLAPVHFFLEDKRPVLELVAGVLGLWVFFIVKMDQKQIIKNQILKTPN